MSPVNNRALAAELPQLLSRVRHTECADGWHELIRETCRHLLNLLGPAAADYHITQVKEKWGLLRVYVRPTQSEWGPVAEHLRQPLSDLLQAAKDESGRICEDCGRR